MTVRAGCTAALVAACIAYSGTAPAGAVVGGSPISVRSAPWAALVRLRLAGQEVLCSGSILDARHVLTAAHCVFAPGGREAAPSSLSVEAGVSGSGRAAPGDAPQVRAVLAVRVHPFYTWIGRSAPDDVAELTLAAPLDLGGRSARAVALPRPGSPFPAGAAVGLAGFGREHRSGGPGGALSWMRATVDPQGSCGAPATQGVLSDNATVLCASSPTSAACNGDSGAGLVTLTAPARLVGVVSGGVGDCAPGSNTLFTYLGAPEVRDFIRGARQPPRAPRLTAATSVDLRWRTPLGPGSTLTCSAGGFTGARSIRYAFLTARGQPLERGSRSTFVIGTAERGEAIACEVTATGPGGAVVAETHPTPPVGSSPSSGGVRRTRRGARAPGGAGAWPR